MPKPRVPYRRRSSSSGAALTLSSQLASSGPGPQPGSHALTLAALSAPSLLHQGISLPQLLGQPAREHAASLQSAMLGPAGQAGSSQPTGVAAADAQQADAGQAPQRVSFAAHLAQQLQPHPQLPLQGSSELLQRPGQADSRAQTPADLAREAGPRGQVMIANWQPEDQQSFESMHAMISDGATVQVVAEQVRHRTRLFGHAACCCCHCTAFPVEAAYWQANAHAKPLAPLQHARACLICPWHACPRAPSHVVCRSSSSVSAGIVQLLPWQVGLGASQPLPSTVLEMPQPPCQPPSLCCLPATSQPALSAPSVQPGSLPPPQQQEAAKSEPGRRGSGAAMLSSLVQAFGGPACSHPRPSISAPRARLLSSGEGAFRRVQPSAARPADAPQPPQHSQAPQQEARHRLPDSLRAFENARKGDSLRHPRLLSEVHSSPQASGSSGASAFSRPGPLLPSLQPFMPAGSKPPADPVAWASSRGSAGEGKGNSVEAALSPRTAPSLPIAGHGGQLCFVPGLLQRAAADEGFDMQRQQPRPQLQGLLDHSQHKMPLPQQS